MQGLLGQVLQVLVASKDSLDLARERMQSVDDLSTALGKRDTILRKLECDQKQRDVLRRIRLYEESQSDATGRTTGRLTLVEATPISGPALM